MEAARVRECRGRDAAPCAGDLDLRGLGHRPQYLLDTDRFGESSDLDFLVEFLEEEPVARSEAFFGLLADLEDLFDRRIDLVVDSAVTNPFFREELEETRRSLFAA